MNLHKIIDLFCFELYFVRLYWLSHICITGCILYFVLVYLFFSVICCIVSYHWSYWIVLYWCRSRMIICKTGWQTTCIVFSNNVLTCFFLLYCIALFCIVPYFTALYHIDAGGWSYAKLGDSLSQQVAAPWSQCNAQQHWDSQKRIFEIKMWRKEK